VDGNNTFAWIDGDAIADLVQCIPCCKERLVAASSSASGCRLDEANRELVLNGRRKPPRAWNTGVMHALIRASGRVVTRDEMLVEI